MAVYMIHLEKMPFNGKERFVILTAEAQGSVQEFLETRLHRKEDFKPVLLWFLKMVSVLLSKTVRQKTCLEGLQGALVYFSVVSGTCLWGESFFRSIDPTHAKQNYVCCQHGNTAETCKAAICCSEESHKQQRSSRAKDWQWVGMPANQIHLYLKQV